MFWHSHEFCDYGATTVSELSLALSKVGSSQTYRSM